jgi:hypothetical protein
MIVVAAHTIYVHCISYIGISLLPPGDDWVCLALIAFGLHYGGIGHNLTPEQIAAAEAFDRACCLVLKDRMDYHAGLSAVLDGLFDIVHEPEDYCAVNEDEVHYIAYTLYTLYTHYKQ